VAFPGTIVGNYIFAYDQQKKLATTTLVGSITNVFMNALLIPFFGIIGAAIATVSAQSIYNALNWRLAKKINNFRILYHLKKIILSALIMGVFSYFLKQLNLHLIINILFSTIIYFITLSLLKEKIINEFKELIKINKIKN
jgi:O-antigen/teichoic acid export membrane protein